MASNIQTTHTQRALRNLRIICQKILGSYSLHDVLHEKNPPPSLEWSVRYKIDIGIAHGLAYLHCDCGPKNILLDSDMEPHIADFGIAKLLDPPSASSQFISVPGTAGYISSENARRTANNRESDLYSHGVVLPELITRKKAIDPSFKEGIDIVGWVRILGSETEYVYTLAVQFLDSNVLEQVPKLLLVALRCTEKDPRMRPTVRDVVKKLEDANPRTRSKKLPSYNSFLLFCHFLLYCLYHGAIYFHLESSIKH